MKSTAFEQWLSDIGPAEAARRITEYQESRGKTGLTYQAIQEWRRNGVPPVRVPAVSAVSGISRHELRPDVFEANAA